MNTLNFVGRGLAVSILRPAQELSVLNIYGFDQTRLYAARKGTRAKRDKKKKSAKLEEKKVGFVPHTLREKSLSKGVTASRRVKDDYKAEPIDDVWIAKFHRWKLHSFEEAINCHRETHHPQIYNQPNAFIRALIELDMRTAKKTKFVDSFTRICSINHTYDMGEDRSILVFCKTPEQKDEAENAGATLVGGADLLKKIDRGEFVLPDFNYILAHPNILPEMSSLRNLLKKKFPNPKSGSLSLDVGKMVHRFKTGLQYTAFRDELELDYGWIDAHFGRLDMETEHLASNLTNLLQDIYSMRPQREGPFVTRVMLLSPPSVERLKINIEDFLPEEFKKDAYESDSDDEKVAKSA